MTTEEVRGGHRDHTGEHAAREGLRSSVNENAKQMLLAQESRELLASIWRNELRDEMRIGVAEGLAAFLSEETIERIWKKGFEVAQKESGKRLRDAAGNLVLDGARGLLKWGSGILVVIVFAYYIGGFALAKTVWIALTKGAP